MGGVQRYLSYPEASRAKKEGVGLMSSEFTEGILVLQVSTNIYHLEIDKVG